MTEEAMESNRHYGEGAKQYTGRSYEYTHVISDFKTIHISRVKLCRSGSENIPAQVHQLPELSLKADIHLSYKTKFPFAPHKKQNM
jgi:hypothetical protein